jgi:uncharacterized protein (DUF2235 family)
VSSVGWIESPLHLPFTADNPSIQHGRHAIAIDERRAFFRPNRWRENDELSTHGPVDCKEVWFPGSHGDVGGGYPEADSGLSKCALRWILDESRALGLLVDKSRMDRVLGLTDPDFARPDGAAKAHESLTWPWWPAEFVFKKRYDWDKRTWGRRMNLGRQRHIPDGALIHAAVDQRPVGYKDRLPKAHAIAPVMEASD